MSPQKKSLWDTVNRSLIYILGLLKEIKPRGGMILNQGWEGLFFVFMPMKLNCKFGRLQKCQKMSGEKTSKAESLYRPQTQCERIVVKELYQSNLFCNRLVCQGLWLYQGYSQQGIKKWYPSLFFYAKAVEQLITKD